MSLENVCCAVTFVQLFYYYYYFHLSSFAGFIPLMRLVYAGEYELRIDIEDFQNETRYAKYSIFGIDFTKNYTIRVQGYTGNAGAMYSCIYLVLSLSLSHTHTHTHTRARAHTLSLSLSLCLSLSVKYMYCIQVQ